MKTFAILMIAMLSLARPGAASSDMYTVFAGCAGRFSAEMEHAWLVGDGAAAEFQDQRKAFLSLMEAAMPPGSARKLLHYRIDFKLAHASLLTIATFGADARRAQAARMTAKAYRADCTRLLLGG